MLSMRTIEVGNHRIFEISDLTLSIQYTTCRVTMTNVVFKLGQKNYLPLLLPKFFCLPEKSSIYWRLQSLAAITYTFASYAHNVHAQILFCHLFVTIVNSCSLPTKQ